ncbi:MAG: Asp-tRNA(Asn)/Glu-tRNA(Gln) amidotransferase subunit GatB, partial [SAR86 cluster bacterium]|nr:Asp-tRNA(Asn)/Glu-tRNA(Gln) amidotransferase subunit GatB [SAR86 cluster bacterium]
FYPDLPKGYQISQLDNPIVEGGVLEITLKDGSKKKIRITRAHLEEDAGKSLHDDFEGLSGIDLNRAGTPLLEIVSEPDLSSPEEAVAYLKKIHSIIRYLEISDGNMAEGSMRCDANVSLRKKGSKKLGTRTETKNVNSFKYVEKAIQHEMRRQIKILESGERVTQETRLYDSQLDETRPMRSKEYANDYRYFPEPDLLPVVLTEDFIKSVKDLMPELSEEKEKRFIKEYKLSDYDANVLSVDPNLSNFFEEVVVRSRNPKLAANWIMGELSAFLNKENLSILETKVDSINLGNLLSRIEDSTISGKIAKEIFEEMWNSKKSPDEIIEEKGLKQVTDSSEIKKVINQVLDQNPSQLEQYKSGKVKLFGFFVGQVMKASRGKANPEQVNKLLEERLKE